ncbi:MAG: hypothetical protein CMD46_06105 [Gammaproteobacteria bacterium]|nr:hypothetical protein [Gammaproteobacteria bacterium]
MKTKKFVRNFHRYLSIFVSIQLLLWTVSGIYFAYNKIELVRGEQYRLPVDIEYRIFDRLGVSIIEKNDNGDKTYETYPNGAKVEPLTKDGVLLIASKKTSLNPTDAILINKTYKGAEFRGRDLPIFKVQTDTEDNINIYINPLTGDISAIRSDSWRLWDLFWALHIMDYQDRDNINNLLLKILSILALMTSISGIVLFFIKK